MKQVQIEHRLISLAEQPNFELIQRYMNEGITVLKPATFWTEDNTYALLINGVCIGLIMYGIEQGINGRPFMQLKGLEIFQKHRNKGYGEIVVGELFERRYNGRKIHRIVGTSHCNALPFWWKMNANFEASKESIQAHYEKGYEMVFVLFRSCYLSRCRRLDLYK